MSRQPAREDYSGSSGGAEDVTHLLLLIGTTFPARVCSIARPIPIPYFLPTRRIAPPAHSCAILPPLIRTTLRRVWRLLLPYILPQTPRLDDTSVQPAGKTDATVAIPISTCRLNEIAWLKRRFHLPSCRPPACYTPLSRIPGQPKTCLLTPAHNTLAFTPALFRVQPSARTAVYLRFRLDATHLPSHRDCGLDGLLRFADFGACYGVGLDATRARLNGVVPFQTVCCSGRLSVVTGSVTFHRCNTSALMAWRELDDTRTHRWHIYPRFLHISRPRLHRLLFVLCKPKHHLKHLADVSAISFFRIKRFVAYIGTPVAERLRLAGGSTKAEARLGAEHQLCLPGGRQQRTTRTVLRYGVAPVITADIRPCSFRRRRWRRHVFAVSDGRGQQGRDACTPHRLPRRYQAYVLQGVVRAHCLPRAAILNYAAVRLATRHWDCWTPCLAGLWRHLPLPPPHVHNPSAT